MALPLPEPKSLGQLILDRMGQGSRNALLNEQANAQRMANQFAGPNNQMNMEQSKAAEQRRNQLFPEQLKKLQMSNQLFMPQTQADINYKNANANRLNFQNQNPLYNQPGVAGQLGAAELLKRNPQLLSNPNALNMLNNSIKNNQESIESRTNLQKQQAKGYGFKSLPADYKEYLIAQADAMGISPEKAREMIASGKGLDQIAIEQGYDPNNLPEPIYPLTKSGQTALKARQAANEEIKSLSKDISDWTAPYSRKFSGYSPSQIKDALLGENKDTQAKYIAGRMLYPELASMRLRAGGGNVGIEAIREMTEKAMGNGKILQSLVSPEVFKRANDVVDEAITKMVTAANKKSTQAIGQKKSHNEDNDPLGIR